MAGKASVGTTQIPKIAVGATPLKKISIGTTEVWSGVDELAEEWSTLDTSIWNQFVDSGGNNQQLYVSGGYLQSPGITTSNRRNYAVVLSKKQYLSPYGKWAILMGDNYNTGLENEIILSSDASNGEKVSLSMTYNSCGFYYRSGAGQSSQQLQSASYGYNTQAWVIVERLENSTYRVSFNGGSTWAMTYQDPDRIGEQSHMGYIGAGICSDRNWFGTQGFGAKVDKFRYTNDPTANIMA